VAGVRPGLKWPNDLVAGDGKLGGVLAETTVAGGMVDAVVVGIGINLRAEDLPAGAVALEELADRPFEGGVLLVTFLRNLDRWWGLVGDGAATGDLVAAAREASATLGRDVRVELAAGAVEGRAEDVDDDGHLVVVDAAGRRHVVAAGDVTHLRALPPG
jgi:BirA family biotin operon repressor/biotin-[acetyl-CoA-carboxylase] ligase